MSRFGLPKNYESPLVLRRKRLHLPTGCHHSTTLLAVSNLNWLFESDGSWSDSLPLFGQSGGREFASIQTQHRCIVHFRF